MDIYLRRWDFILQPKVEKYDSKSLGIGSYVGYFALFTIRFEIPSMGTLVQIWFLTHACIFVFSFLFSTLTHNFRCQSNVNLSKFFVCIRCFVSLSTKKGTQLIQIDWFLVKTWHLLRVFFLHFLRRDICLVEFGLN